MHQTATHCTGLKINTCRYNIQLNRYKVKSGGNSPSQLVAAIPQGRRLLIFTGECPDLLIRSGFIFRLHAGQNQAEWEDQGWIKDQDPRGWFQWCTLHPNSWPPLSAQSYSLHCQGDHVSRITIHWEGQQGIYLIKILSRNAVIKGDSTLSGAYRASSFQLEECWTIQYLAIAALCNASIQSQYWNLEAELN